MAPEEIESPPAPPPVPPARYAVTAPGAVTGGVMGVGFANGHAVVTENQARSLAWFRAEPGYVVVPLDVPEPAPVEAEVEPDETTDETADMADEQPEEDPEWP
ncbi:hypothetical protein [Streptomyces sp. A0592]|uniref:hypothetical protein n=1 Tax=Streptomyces sp. A0592 TaxID=2563099 RepID=UPI00109E4000|nr:hypothetical protein [Streptomyces sp. A0592]THA82728.1 hypothetical protein E6U81_19485 [Streptomyces sp. A0592]